MTAYGAVPQTIDPAAPPVAARPALRVSALSLSYGATAAFSDITFDVAEGEFLALLGPSGCGKTSLLRSIAGLAHPQDGSILIKGVDVVGTPARDRNVGLVFQSYALFPHMTAAQNVGFGLRCRGMKGQDLDMRVREALAMVGLDQLAERRPAQMSGGQQQRIALARALVFKPDLLLLDEALGALDKKLRVGMQTELKRLQRISGITTIFVTHDQEEALAMADRVAVMREGAIVQLAAPATLFNEPVDAWVADFMGAGSVLAGRVEAAQDGVVLRLAGGGAVNLRGHGLAGHAGETVTIYIGADKVKVQPGNPGEEAFSVTSRRYLGAQVEITATCRDSVVRAAMPADTAAALQVGTMVAVGMAAADCTTLSGGH